MMYFRTILLLISANLFLGNALAEETFKDNGKWGTIKTASYRVILLKNGQFSVSIKDSLRFNTRFLMPKQLQKFPNIKSLRAQISNHGNKEIYVKYKYLWNEGIVEQSMKFDYNSIAVSYSYLPNTDKDTRRFMCILSMRDKAKIKNLELVTLGSEEQKGALNQFKEWKRINTRFKMVSLRNSGPYYLDFIAEEKSLIRVMGEPNMAVVGEMRKNLKKRNTVYKKDEEFKIAYLIFISNSDGTNLRNLPVSFIKAN